MKAVVIADSLQGGLGALALEHVRRLPQDFETLLIAPRTDAALAPADVRFAAIDLPLNFWQAVRAGSVRAIRLHLRREAPDIVHAHGIRSFALARLAGGDAWITLHGFGEVASAAWWHTTARRTFRRAVPLVSGGRAISVSPDAPKGWIFLPHASPKLREMEVAGVSRDPVFAWVGRLDRGKRPDLFIQSLAQLRGSATGVIFGDGPHADSLRTLIESTQAPVELVGRVDDLSRLLRDVRAVVLLSEFEGVPFAVEEAMWMGKPVITSRLPGIEWLAGDTAYYADSVEETVRAMRCLLDPGVASELGERAAKRVRELLREDDPWPMLEQMYRDALPR